ncbi:MAG: DNA repair protein RecO [Planctomycetota bacterium]
MPIQSDQAIVLRLTDFSETSQIATLFTARQGLVRLIAKGARRGTAKRFAVGLDLLEAGEVSYLPPRGDAQLGTLTEWVQRNAFAGLRSELVRMHAGFYAAELVSTLTEEYDPHADLFANLRQTLTALANGDDSLRTIATFQDGLLKSLGYAPNYTQCVACNRPWARGAAAFFSSTAGGLLCRDCEMHYVEKRRLPANLPDTDPRTGDARAWFTLQDYYLTHVAGRRLKTADPLRVALGLTAK